MGRMNRCVLLLKFLAASALLTYVVVAGMIDVGALVDVLRRPLYLAVELGLILAAVLLMVWRWRLLAGVQGLSASFGRLLEISMTGFFLGTFMPSSSLGGDVVKGWYSYHDEPERRHEAILTILFDRMLGLLVIVLLAAAMLPWIAGRLDPNISLPWLSSVLWGGSLAGLGLLGYLLLFARPRPDTRVPRGSLGRHVARFLEVWHFAALAWRRPLVLGGAIAMSLGSTLILVLAYWALGRMLGVQLPFSAYLFVVPVVAVVSTIPLLPLGIGVGQVAFFHLFGWLGVEPSQGATLCTLFQIYSALFNALGAPFYVKIKRSAAGGK